MKIICIGRNYHDHISELKNKITNEPLFFLKPDTAIQPKGHPFFIPDFSNNLSISFSFIFNNLQMHCDKKFKIAAFVTKSYI